MMKTTVRRAMQNLMLRSTYYYRIYSTCQTLQSVWRSTVRRADLDRLQKWAERKGLQGPKRHYSKLLIAEEEKLLFLRFRYPQLVLLVSLLHTIVEQIRGEPAYYAKGSAAKYRYR